MMSEGGSAAVLRRLESLFPQEISLELDRVERLLEALGRPQDSLPPVVHVAGTNGKGSFIALLQSILEAAGETAHCFISPHLVAFHERIGIAGRNGTRPIDEQRLTELLLRVEAANDGAPITFFEITTAAALLAFAESPAGFTLLETGLGGRLDATNVVSRPKLTVIMPISLDHVGYLGNTLAAIAREKAGILKAGVPCVVGRQEADALAAIEARAEVLGVPLLAQGSGWDAYEQHGRLLYQTGEALLDLPLPRLIGRHQVDNAGVAIAAAQELLGCRATPEAIGDGLQSAHWPGRLQRLNGGPLDAHTRAGTEILLDGGHNPAAGEALAHAMAELEEKLPRPLHLICGMMGTKDAAGFLTPFAGLAERVITVPIPEREKAHDAKLLAETARQCGLNAAVAQSVPDALAMSREFSSEPVRVLICGSLYLAGDVLELHQAATAA